MKDGSGQLVAMGRSMAITIIDQTGKELASQKLNYGARLMVDDGDTVTRGTRLAQWDPYTRPILTEVDGFADYEDLVEGASMREQTDEVKGTTNRVVIDWRASARGAELKPAMVVKDKNGQADQGRARWRCPVTCSRSTRFSRSSRARK